MRGHRLYVEQRGPSDGEHVIFLHHGLGSVLSWKRQLLAFAGEGWRALAYDRWGYGHSDRRTSFAPGFLLDEAESCLALLDRIGIKKASFIGHSDGGTIALLFASKYPDRTKKVVAVAAHGYFEPKIRDGLRYIDETARIPPVLQVLEHEHGERALPLLDAWLAHWRDIDLEGISMMDQLAGIASPVLVIQGELDEHTSVQHAKDIAEGVQDGQLWIIPGVHHMPPHEIPDEFNRRTMAFLRS